MNVLQKKEWMYIGKLLFWSSALISLVFVFSCKQTNGGGGNEPTPSNEITITVQGDDGLVVATSNSFKVQKGQSWQDFKDKATKKITTKNGKDIKEWRIKDINGDIVRNATIFEKDETVFAVSKDKKTKHKVMIEGDERVKVSEPKYIEVSADEVKTIGDIKTEILAKASINESEWSTEDYCFFDWRIGGEHGQEMLDSMQITDDMVVYARTNYKKFKLQGDATNGYVVRGYEGEKPRGRIFIPKDTLTIWLRCFEKCEDLTTVDFSYAGDRFGTGKFGGILSSAFNGCTSLTSVNLTGCSEITKMWTSIFQDCTSLTSIDLSPCTKLKNIGTHAFGGCSALENVNLTGCTAIETIELEAFVDCESLESIDLSPLTNLTVIEGSVFRGCKNLRNVNLTGLERADIRTALFEGCVSLKTIDLSPLTAIKNIPERLFKDCSSLESVIWGERPSIDWIGGEAFLNCTSLESMDLSPFVSLKGILKDIFKGCSNLKAVNFDGCSEFAIVGLQAFQDCISLKKVDFSHCERLEEIRDRAFQGCSVLESVNLTGCDEIKELGFNAFFGCANLGDVDLSQCTKLPAIGGTAFHGCVKTTVKLPTSIKEVGEKAFGESEENFCKKVLVPNAEATIKTLVTTQGYPEARIEMY